MGNASGKSKSNSNGNALGVGGNSNGNSNDNNNDNYNDDVDGGNQSRTWEGHSAGGLISPPRPHLAKARQPSAVCGGSPGGRGSSRRKGSADQEGHSAGGLVNPSLRFRAQVGESAREVTDPANCVVNGEPVGGGLRANPSLERGRVLPEHTLRIDRCKPFTRAGASSPRANSTGIDRCKPFWPAYL